MQEWHFQPTLGCVREGVSTGDFMRKLVFLFVFVCALAGARSAYAVDGGPGDPEPPVIRTHQASLTVTPPSGGSISGTGISCPGDCVQDLDYEESCEFVGIGGETCTPLDASTVRLTAGRGAGWTADWHNGDCSAEPSANVCDVEVLDDETVSLTWLDTGAPTVGFSSPAAVAGPSTVFTASASDNAGIAKADFFIDNVQRGTDTSPPYQFSPDLSLLADGSSHTLKVISQDTSGNRSSDLAGAPSHSFTADRSTGLSAVSAPGALVDGTPSVSFTPPADVKSGGVTCRTKRDTTVTGTQTGCTSPYSAQVAGDGAYTVELTVEDRVGNTATVTRSFTLDTTDPQLSITGGPAAGAVVQARAASFNFSSSDANGVTLACKLDGGAFGPCSGADSHTLSGLSLGGHTFVVRAMDGAGNVVTVERAFTVQDPPAPVGGGNAGADGNTGTNSATNTETGAATSPGAGGPGPGAGNGPGAGITGTPSGQGETAAEPLVVAARSSAKFSVRGGKTKVSKLNLTRLARGAVVEVTCKGNGCPRGTTKFNIKKSTLKLAAVFKRRTLRARARIEVRVTQRGRTGRVFRYTTQKGKKKPKAQTLCLPAGASTPKACG